MSAGEEGQEEREEEIEESPGLDHTGNGRSCMGRDDWAAVVAAVYMAAGAHSRTAGSGRGSLAVRNTLQYRRGLLQETGEHMAGIGAGCMEGLP